MAIRSHKKVKRTSPKPRISFWKRLDSRLGSIRGYFLAVAVVSNLILCLALFDPKPHSGGDNASYILLAESILRAGDGYSDTVAPGPRLPHTQYAFGYPLLLTPIVAAAGRNIVLLKLFSMFLSLAIVVVFSRLVERISSSSIAWAGLTLAVAFNPVVVEYSHWILSEEAFLFFSLLSLYFLLGAEQEKVGGFGKKFWLAVITIAFTAHIRTIGVGFVLAGLAFFTIRRQWPRLAVFALSICVLMSPWMIRNHLVKKNDSGYVTQLLMKNPYSPEEGTVGPAGMAARFVRNVGIYAGSEMARVILGTGAFKLSSTAVKAVSIAASLLFVLGFIMKSLEKVGIIELYVIVFIAVVLLWPDVWSDVRYIMPIVPLILFYLLHGASVIVRAFYRQTASNSVVVAVSACLIAISSISAQAMEIPGSLRNLNLYLRGDRYAGYHPAWRNLFQAGDWIRENTPEESVITVRKPRLFYLHTRRRVEGYPFTTDTDSVLTRITATDYVVVDAVSGTTYRYLIPAIQKVPERFKLVYRLDKPFTGVLEVVK